MQQYTVEITDKALADMEKIYTYIVEQFQTPENAMGQYNRIADAVQKLNVFPECVRIKESEPEHTMRLRQLSVDNFSVFYIIEDDKVIVTRVLYSASDISKRLSDS